ncbi:hypothetical protein [Mucilaginibacter hurinus]|nr:hypothetical protein [Mucilaginibacter hurinus]
MKTIFCALIVSVAVNTQLLAQHVHHQPETQAPVKDSTATPIHDNHTRTTDGGKHQEDGRKDSLEKHHQHKHSGATHAYSLSLPMTRNGSGTSWLPDNSPMYMLMAPAKNGTWMFHGSVFMRYNNQQINGKTTRSGAQFDAPNWFMAMYNKRIGGNGLLNVSAMLSADPLTVTQRGYPLLFQSGESYKGQTLVDRQHPHDLFSGLSIAYTQRLNSKIDVFGYFGYPGEPALGAPAFMHRIIAMNDPDAPLGHHWQDATHITYGVATMGVRLDKFKVEGSVFTGREPDENRYDFDKMRFDSYSWRTSFNPDASWVFQVSQAYINSPELLHPHNNVWRYSASAIYASKVTNSGRYFTGSLVWGMNDGQHGPVEHSLLAEGTRQFTRQAVYGRYEFVQKSAHELALEEQFGDALFNVHKLTLGTNRKLFKMGPVELIGGVQASVNFSPTRLHSLYGRAPVSGQVYIQLRPALMKHN